MTNHYEILGIAMSASAKDLRSAYLRRVLETHPDKGGDQRTFCAVVLAFQELSRLSGPSSAGRPSTPEMAPHTSRSSRAEQNYLEKATLLLQSMSPKARHSAILAEFSKDERVRMEALLSVRNSQRVSSASGRKAQVTGERPLGESCDDLGSASSSDEAETCADAKRRQLQANTALDGDTYFASDQISEHGVRGIHRTVFESKSGSRVLYYNAEVCLNCGSKVYFYMISRKRRELARCVEDHIALTQVVDHVRARRQHKSLEDSLSEAFASMTLEHSLTVGAGKRHRGACAFTDMRCLFLRYDIHVNLDCRFDTNMPSPRYFDLEEALQALQRIRLVRGTQEVSWKTPFPKLQHTLSKVRSEMTKLYLEAAKSNPKAASDEQEVQSEVDAIHGSESACNVETNVEQHMLQKEERYLGRRDTSLLRRLQRTVQQERCKEEERRRRDERQQKRFEELQQKEVREQRRKELLRWDPRETFGAMQRRFAKVSSTYPSGAQS